MGGFYPDELIEEIRSSNDIADVISEYVTLKKSGRNYFGLCPFHNEKTPSFSVSSEKQIFHCFGCHEGGNVITFLMKVENISFSEVIEILAKRARINLPEKDISDELKKKNQIREQILNINVEAARFYHNNLVCDSGKKALEYLNKRGLSSNTIKKFGLGYSLDNWDSLNKYLISKGFSQGLILKAGLAKKSKGSNNIDTFRNRIIFPIFDLSSKVIAFGGRALGDAMPKYLNSAETSLFNKSKNLFCLNIAKNSDAKNIIIVEGYMDAITLHQHGINNVVASLGTALTESQAKLLKKHTDEVVIAYDSDTAGQSATLRGIQILNDTGISIKVLQLPEGKDPDEYVKKYGVDKFRYLVNNSKTYIQFKMDILRAQNNLETVDGKINFLNKMSEILSKIDNVIERDAYIKIISNETGISADSITAQINKKLYKHQNVKKDFKINKSNNEEIVVDKKLDHIEKTLIYLICQENIYKKFEGKISSDLFKNPINKKIAEFVIANLSKGEEIEPGQLMISLNDESEIRAISQIFAESLEFDDFEKAVNDYINYIREVNKKEKIFEFLKQSSDVIENDLGMQQKLKQLIKDSDLKTGDEGR